jgi:hypothetical protein
MKSSGGGPILKSSGGGPMLVMLEDPLVTMLVAALNGSANATTEQIVTQIRTDLGTRLIFPPPSAF